MGRLIGLFAILLLLASCGPTGVLYTDAAFRSAAPEIVSAWNAEGPFRDARTVAVPSTDLSTLRQSLGQLSAGTAVLLGLLINPEDYSTLQASFPRLRFVLLGPPREGASSLSVDLRQARDAIAAALARLSPDSLLAILASNSTLSEREHLRQVWQDAKGSNLEIRIWPDVGDTKAFRGPILQWAGAVADGSLAGILTPHTVGGPPDLVTAPGVTLVTWAIDPQGLPDFLWTAVKDPPRGARFFALKTLTVNR